ncbi:uncharacterized protein N7515_003722 [Penicillium bovifimosum]|uniref:Uncharacterized protein n=1 Tax=Penicillium bovifimosum TaxID=126998 RepID=A0A9W9H6J8_9EURO|nr:uncharacterized protein N7515_003722 [Penicillium bovifimosum]KAJ5138874.1 hypothetical protein N7515_003722 [Penicillium bovifimosum]
MFKHSLACLRPGGCKCNLGECSSESTPPVSQSKPESLGGVVASKRIRDDDTIELHVSVRAAQPSPEPAAPEPAPELITNNEPAPEPAPEPIPDNDEVVVIDSSSHGSSVRSGSESATDYTDPDTVMDSSHGSSVRSGSAIATEYIDRDIDMDRSSYGSSVRSGSAMAIEYIARDIDMDRSSHGSSVRSGSAMAIDDPDIVMDSSYGSSVRSGSEMAIDHIDRDIIMDRSSRESSVRPALHDPTKDYYLELRRFASAGAHYQTWIENPQAPGCTVKPATTTWRDMQKLHPRPWGSFDEGGVSMTSQLRGGDPESLQLSDKAKRAYLKARVSQSSAPGTRKTPYPDNHFEGRMAEGIIVVDFAIRNDGLYLSEVMRGLYTASWPIQTLRHIVFTDLEEMETGKWMQGTLFPDYIGMQWWEAVDKPPVQIERGTLPFAELLGTKLGKAVACLVLGAWPRGSMRIARAFVWNHRDVPQLRFDLELTNPKLMDLSWRAAIRKRVLDSV